MTFFYQYGSIPFQRVDSVLSTYFHLFNYVFVIVILIAELKNRNCCWGSDLSHLHLSITGCKKIIKKVSFLGESLFVGVWSPVCDEMCIPRVWRKYPPEKKQITWVEYLSDTGLEKWYVHIISDTVICFFMWKQKF